MSAASRTRGSGSGDDDDRMPLVGHLVELRDRVFKSVLALAVAFAVAVSVGYDPILRIVRGPYCELPVGVRGDISGTGECSLVFLGVADGFLLRMRLSLIVALVVAAPIWLYQLWAFIVPGLHAKERRYAVPFVVTSATLFMIGAVFAYVTLDRGLSFLLGFGGDGVTSLLAADRYLNYVIFILIAFGVSFQFPLILISLELVGVLDAEKLKRWRRGMAFGVAVFAAVITPSQDPFTFFAMAGPMWLSYEVVVIYARIHGRAKARKAAAESTQRWDDDETSPLDDVPADVDA